MSWRVVHIKDGEYLRLKLDNIEIEKEGKKYYIPLSDIASIILEGQTTTLTTRLLDKCTQYNIVLIICDLKYQPSGIFLPLIGHHRTAKRSLIQTGLSSLFKEKVWTRIVSHKMNNQYLCALYRSVDENRLNKMEEYINKLKLGDPYNCEGQVAHMYFEAIYYPGFSRQFDCLENMAMNFGYSVLRSYIARCVVSQGLLPMLGVHHCNEYNQFNLVDDLMEPFRPLMDYWIFLNILDDNPYLSYEKRLKIIDFLNQNIYFEGHKRTMKYVIELYVTSFYKAMVQENERLLKEIHFTSFVEALEDEGVEI